MGLGGDGKKKGEERSYPPPPAENSAVPAKCGLHNNLTRGLKKRRRNFIDYFDFLDNGDEKKEGEWEQLKRT